MKVVNNIISDYLVSSSAVLDNGEPITAFLASWDCLTLIAQINLNRHSNKNKNDRDKIEFLFKDYRKNIALILVHKNNLINLENILSIVKSGCPILITKFEDIKDTVNNTNGIFQFAASSDEDASAVKEAEYFMECLASLIHLGKNKLFKSLSLDRLSDNYESYDIQFCENASQLIFSIIRGIIKVE